jgi:hypothetical protein
MPFSLFRRKNFTRRWRRHPGVDLAVDLSTNSFGGVMLGARVDDLSFLGPSEAPKRIKDGEICYPSLGLIIGFEPRTSRFSGLSICWKDVGNDGFSPFEGTLRNNEVLLVSEQAGARSQLLDTLGEPYWGHVDADEELLFYERAGVEWQFEFSLEGELQWLTVTSSPLMADERQRELYRVDKPWPPE